MSFYSLAKLQKKVTVFTKKAVTLSAKPLFVTDSPVLRQRAFFFFPHRANVSLNAGEVCFRAASPQLERIPYLPEGHLSRVD